MTKKRRIPAGKIPSDLRQVGRSLENEVLALALEWGKNWLQPTQGRLLQRHREITQAQADELDKRCRKAMETSFAIVTSDHARSPREGWPKTQRLRHWQGCT